MALQFGTATSMTITAGSLASGANRSSAAVTTGTTNNVVDYLIEVSVQTTSSAPSGNKQVVVYAYWSVDGTNYIGANGTIDNVDGTDKALASIPNASNLRQIGTVQLSQGAVATTIRGSFSLCSGLGFPAPPPKWGVVLLNDAGIALGAAVTAQYREVSYS